MLTQTIPAQIESILIELFWQHVHREADHLELLQIFARQPVIRSAEWNTESIREQATRGTTLSADRCFGCGTHDRKLYWHHIVQVQNGGSNNPRNRVAICLRCHATIHPWLPKNRKGEQRGGEWWSMSEVMQDARQHETSIGDLVEIAPAPEEQQR